MSFPGTYFHSFRNKQLAALIASLVVAACHDASAPAVLTNPAGAAGSRQRADRIRAPADPDFVEHERFVVQGNRHADGRCDFVGM